MTSADPRSVLDRAVMATNSPELQAWSTEHAAAAEQRVQLWFGPHVLRTYRAESGAAEEYARAIGRRFPGLRVTLDRDVADGMEPLPGEQLWSLTP